MYRAVTLAAQRQRIDWNDADALARIASELKIDLTDQCVFLDGEDVTDEIRSFEITTLTRHAADNQTVRKQMVELQRQMAGGRDVVTEGRDQATIAFPNAQCKIYLTAGEEVRAQRRYRDLIRRGEQVTYAEVLEKQHQRDQRDRKRKFGGLEKTDDSFEVLTDELSPEEVINRLERLVRSRQSR